MGITRLKESGKVISSRILNICIALNPCPIRSFNGHNFVLDPFNDGGKVKKIGIHIPPISTN